MSSEEISKDLKDIFERETKFDNELLAALDELNKKEVIEKQDVEKIRAVAEEQISNKGIENSILAITETTKRCKERRVLMEDLKFNMEKEEDEQIKILSDKKVKELQQKIDEEEKSIEKEKDNLKKLFDTQHVKLEKFVELSNNPKLKGEDAKNIIDDIVSKFTEKEKKDIAMLEENKVELNGISNKENSKNNQQDVDKEKSDSVQQLSEMQLQANKVNIAKDDAVQLDNALNKVNMINSQEDNQKDNDENIKSQFKSFKNLAEEKRFLTKWCIKLQLARITGLKKEHLAVELLRRA